METETKNITIDLALTVVDTDETDIRTKQFIGELQTAIPQLISKKFNDNFKLIDYQEDQIDDALTVMLFFESKQI